MLAVGKPTYERLCRRALEGAITRAVRARAFRLRTRRRPETGVQVPVGRGVPALARALLVQASPPMRVQLCRGGLSELAPTIRKRT